VNISKLVRNGDWVMLVVVVKCQIKHKGCIATSRKIIALLVSKLGKHYGNSFYYIVPKKSACGLTRNTVSQTPALSELNLVLRFM